MSCKNCNCDQSLTLQERLEQAEKALVETRRERDEMRDAREESMRDRDAARKDCDRMLGREDNKGLRERLGKALSKRDDARRARDDMWRERDEMRKIAEYLAEEIALQEECPSGRRCAGFGAEVSRCRDHWIAEAKDKIK